MDKTIEKARKYAEEMFSGVIGKLEFDWKVAKAKELEKCYNEFAAIATTYPSITVLTVIEMVKFEILSNRTKTSEDQLIALPADMQPKPIEQQPAPEK
jgi:hypothetical protein